MGLFDVQNNKVAAGAIRMRPIQMADRWAEEFRFSDIFDLGANMQGRIADRAAQKAADAYGAQQAQIQRDWETKMDNTKYQRAVKDLQAAGFSLWRSYRTPLIGSFRFCASYSQAGKGRSKEKSSLGDLAALAIRVLGLLALKH